MPLSQNTPTDQKPPFKDSNLELSTALVLAGIRLLGTEKEASRTFFVFEADPRIEPIISQFYSNELRFNPRDVFQTWKGLRELTFAVRGNVR